MAFGGKEALVNARVLKYTLNRTSYSTDTSHTSLVYTLDLPNKHITAKEYNGNDTIVKSIAASGAWLVQNGRRSTLPEKEQQRLRHVFLTNFIPMLQNDSLVYEHIKTTKYKNHEADIVRLYTPDKKAILLDLFVAADGKIITSSRPDEKTGGYLYFADELDYNPIGGGIVFPMVYKVWKEGRLIAEGVFENVLVE